MQALRFGYRLKYGGTLTRKAGTMAFGGYIIHRINLFNDGRLDVEIRLDSSANIDDAMAIVNKFKQVAVPLDFIHVMERETEDNPYTILAQYLDKDSNKWIDC